MSSAQSTKAAAAVSNWAVACDHLLGGAGLQGRDERVHDGVLDRLGQSAAELGGLLGSCSLCDLFVECGAAQLAVNDRADQVGDRVSVSAGLGECIMCGNQFGQ
jgi:hypothetical protein